MDNFALVEMYNYNHVEEVPTGKRYTFSMPFKGDYLEIIVFDEGCEVKFIDDNYPFPRKFFSTSIPYYSNEEFETDLRRMGIVIPHLKNK